MAGWCSGVLPVWWVLGWGWLPGAGIGDAPAAAWFGGGGCPCVVWGWHAVGVLGQCALVAWPAFSASLFVGGVGGGCGWVGCELYSGREHLTVSLRQVFCRVLCCLFL